MSSVFSYSKHTEHDETAGWESKLKDAIGGEAVEYYDSIASTQLRARELAQEGVPRAIVVAGEQTAGRGRAARRWESPKDSGLYASVLFRPSLPQAKAHLVNIAAALSVAEAVRSLSGQVLSLKWPNDLLNGEDRKLCGILSESATREGTLDHCITGIGINLFEPPSLPPDIAKRAGWLRRREETLDALELLSRVMKNFFGWIGRMERGGVTLLLEVYRSKCASIGRTVKVETEEETLTGLCSGIGDEGELILETPGGQRRFHVADVTHAKLE
jgi:BirA family biotin operon repressor/biotin-[acetyl-CoA-carboxylase] ligase